MREHWPVVVVGAGPAGALAAYLLARAGVDVLLVDRASFPRWKVCGCCLNPWALATLRQVGLGELSERLKAVPLSELCWAAGGSSARVSLPAGVSLSRQAFDMGLIEAAIGAGAKFRPQTTAHCVGQVSNLPKMDRLETCPHEYRPLRLQTEGGSSEITTQVLLAADGLGGQLLAQEMRSVIASHSRIGAGAIAPAETPFFAPGIIYMTSAADGYVGLVRLEDGTLDLAAALDPVAVKRLHVAETVRHILQCSGWPTWPNPATLTWHGTPALTRRPAAVSGTRLFLIGDASGYVEPFTGEGIGWALASAQAVIPFVLEALSSWHNDIAARWQLRHQHLFTAARRRCRLVTTLLRSPGLTALAVRVLAHFPALARPWIPFQGVA